MTGPTFDPRPSDLTPNDAADTEPLILDPAVASPPPAPAYATSMASLPPVMPAAPVPPRRGLMGLGWAWWAAGGCGVLLLCCLCTMILALALVAGSGRNPTIPAAPRPEVIPNDVPPVSSEDASPPASGQTAPSQGGSFGTSPTGSAAPEFALRTLDGQMVNLSDFRGHPVVINFWATWCGPCQAEMPLLSKMYGDEKDNGVIVLAVDVQETPSIVQRYADQKQLPFTVLLDQSGAITNQYRVRAYPTTFFVDANGVVQSWQVGTLSQTTLSRHLDRIR